MGTVERDSTKAVTVLQRFARFAAGPALLGAVLLLAGLGATPATAAITAGTWTTLYTSATYPSAASVAYTIPAGTNRVVLVAVSSARSAVGTQTCTVTYGGQALTLVSGDTTSATPRQHTALYLLKESGIAAATNSNFALTVSGGTSTFTHIMAATFTGVDQTTPYNTTNGARNYSSGTGTTAAPAFATALTEGVGTQPVVIVSSLRTGSTTARTITAATNWSIPTGANLSGANTDALRSTVVVRTQPTAAATDTAPATISTASLASMTGVALAPAATAAALTVSGNTAIASGNRLETEAGVLMQRLQVQATGSLELTTLTLDNPGTATSIASAEVYISGTSQTTLPTDAVLIGSTASWGGTSTALSLNQGTATDRTVGTTARYVYIVYDMAVGQATKTVGSRVTAVGVVSPNTGATGLTFSSNLVTLDAAGNQPVVSASTPIASGTAKDSDTAVLMLRFQVASSTGADNALELTSVTLEDPGTAPAVDVVKVYVSPTAQATLPSDAVQVGQLQEWNKASTAVALVDDYGSTSADRTVLAGSPKYLYVVYSMYYADDAAWIAMNPPNTAAAPNVQAKVTALGVASPDSSLTGLSLLSNTITLTRGTWSRITSCGGCHATSGLQDAATRNESGTGRFPGVHYKHANQLGFDCSTCHVKPTVYNHANGSINLGGSLSGHYSKGDAFAVSNAMPSQPGTCSALYCHSSGVALTGAADSAKTVTWQAGALACNGCHGTAADTTGAPAYTTLAKSPSANNAATGWTNPANAYAADSTYATHAVATQNALLLTGEGYTATDVPAGAVINGITVTVRGNGASATAADRELQVQLVKGGVAVGTALTLQLNQTTDTERTVGGTTNLWGTTWTPADVTATNFGVSLKHNNTTTGQLNVDSVRVAVYAGTSPKANSHAKHAYSCNTCHSQTVNASGTIVTSPLKHANSAYEVVANGTSATFTYSAGACSTVSCHGPATWGISQMNCISCHNSAVTIKNGPLAASGTAVRDAATPEFGLAYGHKKTGRAAVTPEDCIVCHLEGNSQTKTASAKHGDGYIDLRDPDGTTTEAAIKDMSGADYRFDKFATSYAAGARTSTGHTANTIDNILTQKFCLACHDSNGASNTGARTSTGTQYSPFGGVNLGTNYTVLNGAAAAGGLVDVKTQTLVTNSSRHPIQGPNSRIYPYSTRLAAPYDNIGTTRNSNTQAANTASPRVAANSVVLNCFDCHNAATVKTGRTVSAHGNAEWLRGTYATTTFVGSPTLCTTCHRVSGQGTANGYLLSSQHGTGSGFAVGNNNIGTNTRTCNNCHFSSYLASTTARPIRGFDVHGFNGLLSTGGAWTYGNANGMRPVALIRNTGRWSALSPRPYSATGITAGQSNCGGSGALGNCSSQNHSNYSPGGSY